MYILACGRLPSSRIATWKCATQNENYYHMENCLPRKIFSVILPSKNTATRNNATLGKLSPRSLSP